MDTATFQLPSNRLLVNDLGVMYASATNRTQCRVRFVSTPAKRCHPVYDKPLSKRSRRITPIRKFQPEMQILRLRCAPLRMTNVGFEFKAGILPPARTLPRSLCSLMRSLRSLPRSLRSLLRSLTRPLRSLLRSLTQSLCSLMRLQPGANICSPG